jgi:hypothetical protein
MYHLMICGPWHPHELQLQFQSGGGMAEWWMGSIGGIWVRPMEIGELEQIWESRKCKAVIDPVQPIETDDYMHIQGGQKLVCLL